MACAETDLPDAFYSYDLRDPAERAAMTSFAPAHCARCARCPVRRACAEWGVRYETAGVWGGMLPYQRQQVRRRLREDAACEATG